jgi:hypothetical protein
LVIRSIPLGVAIDRAPVRDLDGEAREDLRNLPFLTGRWRWRDYYTTANLASCATNT